MKTLNLIILGVVATALLSVTPLHAATYNLTATPGTVTMPDGAVVPVWGLVEGANLPLTPVPVLTDTAGATLTINLTNQLPVEPVSLVIHGQTASEAGALTPVFSVDANGRQRVTSFTHVAAAGGGTASYSWSNLRPGTYLITSGSHPSVQVPMGLYAVLRVTGGVAGEAYPGIPYTKEVPLLFSEIDPALNQAVSAGIYGDKAGAYPTALKIGYKPKYFLINGRPWSAGALPQAAFAPDNTPAAIVAGDVVLLRMLNAGLRPRMPLFPGQVLTMIAEDGYPYNFQPQQYTADLVAGKTLDALLTIPPLTDPPAADTYLPFYDRMLGLAGGGMHGYLAIGTSATTLDVTVTGKGSVSSTSLTGGITACTDAGGVNCTASLLTGTTVTLRAVAQPAVAAQPGPPPVPAQPDYALTGWSVTAGGVATGECTGLGDCIVTLDQAKTVAATFTPFTTVTLVSPDGGEFVSYDGVLPIRWAAPAEALTFDIGYALSPGAPFRKLTDRVAGREYLWNMSASNIRPSTAVRLAIVGYDAAGNIVGRDAITAPFALTSPLQLTYPNGTVGEPAVIAGATVAVTWAARPTGVPVTRATLLFQPNPAAKWSVVADVDATLGTYNWTVPATLTGATARLALTLYGADGNVIATDTSDAPFSIGAAPPAPAALSRGASFSHGNASLGSAPSAVGSAESGLVLLSPNGSEVLAAEAPFTVLWQAPDQAASYALDYSIDGGQNWRKLARDLSDTQFDWAIDTELSGSKSVLLKVTAYDDNGKELAQDRSDETFSID